MCAHAKTTLHVHIKAFACSRKSYCDLTRKLSHAHVLALASSHKSYYIPLWEIFKGSCKNIYLSASLKKCCLICHDLERIMSNVLCIHVYVKFCYFPMRSIPREFGVWVVVSKHFGPRKQRIGVKGANMLGFIDNLLLSTV